MDPFGITSIADLVVQGTVKVVDWVDHAIKKAPAKKYAFQHLRDALTALRDDIEFYQVLLRTLSLAGVTGSPPSRDEAEQDLTALKSALGDLKTFLDKVMHAHPPKRHPPSEDELATYQSQVECHREKNKGAFKLLWYSLRKDTFRIPPDAFIIPSGGKHMDALDTVSSLFHHHPFAIPVEAEPTAQLHILNRDQGAIEVYDRFMQRAGRRWVVDRVNEQPQSSISDDSDTELLRETQISLFEILWTNTLEQWKGLANVALELVPRQEPPACSPQEPEPASRQGSTDELGKLGRKLQASISLAKKPTFTTAFCGMAKAGKSLFLNALIGTSILPSDEFPSTAWPCRVRHVEGQKEPKLRYDQALFLVALEKLRGWKYGAMMKNFTPPMDADGDTSKDLADSMKIWHRLNDLHETTKYNLEQFQKPNFQLKKSARGRQEVTNLLFQLNDIARICQRFDPGFGMDTTDWPLLTLEFPMLRGRKTRGIFEFIDLPVSDFHYTYFKYSYLSKGMGERFQQFETLVQAVAKRSDAIVPIVSLLNMHSDDSLGTLPAILDGCDIKCNAVICTNLDRVGRKNRDRHNSTVTAAFWPLRKEPPKPGIILCSPLIGISAQALLDLSQNRLPALETFWGEEKIGHPAAEKILGEYGDEVFMDCTYDDWKAKIARQITESGLPSAIEVLCEDIVNQARPRVMMQELGHVYRFVCTCTSDSSRILEGARRTRAEYDTAKEGFERDKESYNKLLCDWMVEEEAEATKLQNEIDQNLREVEEATNKVIVRAFEKVLQKQNTWVKRWLFRDEVEERSNQAWDLKVNATSLDEFLHSSQEELATSLGKLRIKVTPVVKKLQREACKERIRVLAARIKGTTFEGDALQQQIERNILDQLVSIYSLAKVKHDQIKEIVEEPYGIFAHYFPLTFVGIHLAITSRSFSSMRRATARHFRKTKVCTDAIKETYQSDIVTPWLEAMKKEMNGKKALSATTLMARDIFNKFLASEETRFREELEQLAQPMDEQTMRQKVVIHGNLVATEAALEEILTRTKACMPTA